MSRSLRAGLNLSYLVADSGGSGRYARELIPAMLRTEPSLELTAWIGSTAPETLTREPWAGEVRWERLPVPGVGSPWHFWHELVAMGFAARRHQLDVIHGLAYLIPAVTPGLASVVTTLDVIWMHERDALSATARTVMRTLAPLCAHRADRVIAISQAAAEDISRTLRVRREKIDVTPLAVAGPPAGVAAPEQEMRARLGLPDRTLLLCVAAKRAHKNLDGLIRALGALPPAVNGAGRPLLVLPGSPTDYERSLRDLAAELGVQDDVAFPAWVSEADLEALYAAASAFVLPSFQEGFGLPVLEAMARGVPVACSNTSSLPEVAGDAALLFDPRDVTSIAGAVSRLLNDPALAADLSSRGRARAAEFTWARTAELTLASYRRAIERSA
jgi:glycosyltransferase involved in cell wall biosynthesis